MFGLPEYDALPQTGHRNKVEESYSIAAHKDRRQGVFGSGKEAFIGP